MVRRRGASHRMQPVAAYADDAFPAQIYGRRSASAGATAGRKRSDFPWLRVCLASSAVAAALVVLARQPELHPFEASARPRIELASSHAPPPAWERMPQPTALYAIDAPDLQGLPIRHEARRDPEGARDDTLTFGAAEDGLKPYFQLVVRLSAQPERSEASFFVDLARRAAEAGLAVTRSASPGGVRTKFGTAEVADVTLAGDAERACLAFRLPGSEALFRAGGWFCGASDPPPSRDRLACLIDGLSLRGSGDQALKALFSQAEGRRDLACAPPPRVVAASKPASASRNARRR